MYFDELKEMLCRELEELTMQGLNAGALEAVGDLLDAIKDIETIEAMQGGYSRDGYARDGYARDDYSNYGRRTYVRDGYANEDYSNRYRKRDSMGRYSRDNESLVKQVEQMMGDAKSDKEREEIKKSIMDSMEKFM